MTKKTKKRLIIGGIVVAGGAITAVGIGCAIKIARQKEDEIAGYRNGLMALSDRIDILHEYIYDNCGVEALAQLTNNTVEDLTEYYEMLKSDR